MSQNSKIVRNTSLLYLRMAFILIVNLVTVRLVFRGLGDIDYGIFNVITGVVIIFQSISSILATSTQRFYSYALGENKLDHISQIYTASIHLYAALSIIIFLIAETIGLWFINAKLNIPASSIHAANWLYQLSVFSFVFAILQTAFSSALLAYEDMNIFSIISICDCTLKFLAAIVICFIHSDRLIWYGFFLMVISLISLLIYITVVKRRYIYCKYRKTIEKSIRTRILNFSGWHLFSSIASVAMIQVNTILVNIFFGLVVNASRGIALQINSAMTSFSSSFIMAIRPPMIKAYAERNYNSLDTLFDLGNKIIYYLMVVIVIPLFVEMNWVLQLWLGNVEEYMVVFSRLILIYSLILSLNNPISIIVQASGRLKNYFLYVEMFTILCPFATYILYKIGYPPQATFYAMVFSISCAHIVRLICLKKIYTRFSIKRYIRSFLFPAFIITIIAFLVAIIIKSLFGNPFIIILSSVSATLLCAYCIALSKSEKTALKRILNDRVASKFRK